MQRQKLAKKNINSLSHSKLINVSRQSSLKARIKLASRFIQI